jgi:NhaA family Na+:H+ antiporter
MRVNWLTPYLVTGVVMWGAMLASGVHASVAGVLLAFLIPATTKINSRFFHERASALLDEFDRSEGSLLLVLSNRGQQEAVHALEVVSAAVQAPLLRLEHRLHGVVTFAILPLFALANSGVALVGLGHFAANPVTWGVVLGLIAGKPIGIMAGSWLAVRTGISRLPGDVTWSHMFGVACLGGIGFTMSLFVAGLAFEPGEMLDAAKVAVMGSSIAAGVLGWWFMRRAAKVRAPVVATKTPPVLVDPSEPSG